MPELFCTFAVPFFSARMESQLDILIRDTEASIKQSVGHAEELMETARREQLLLDALVQAQQQLKQEKAETQHWKTRCTQAEQALDAERQRPMNNFNGCKINEYIENKWNYGDNIHSLSDSATHS